MCVCVCVCACVCKNGVDTDSKAFGDCHLYEYRTKSSSI